MSDKYTPQEQNLEEILEVGEEERYFTELTKELGLDDIRKTRMLYNNIEHKQLDTFYDVVTKCKELLDKENK